METYSIKNLSFSYPEQERLVLNNVNLDINQGEFIVLCGPSGCGKTTLLRQLKTVLSPHGNKSGEVLFYGDLLEELDQREQSSRIGFVLQSPENQIVTDKVWHELAFGLESLGYDTPTIRLRVAEMASFFGIQNWFYKDVNELSGGQKQLLNLAAIMAMQPSVLILDEPTSQLDPIAAGDFLATVGKINRELGTTIILTEHRLEDAFPLANRAIVMDRGRIIANGRPKDVGQQIGNERHKMFLAMPAAMRVYAAVKNQLDCPITVKEGREWIDKFSKTNSVKFEDNSIGEYGQDKKITVEIDEAWFKYEKELPDVLKGVSLKAYEGETLAILGGNGTGKTTTLSLISGINKPYRGKVIINGIEISSISNKDMFNGLLGVLPQNPQSLFVKKTVKLDLYEMLKGRGFSEREKDIQVRKVSYICGLDSLIEQHPYDLSGGEQQRAALAKVLLLEPKILLLDEPTKGIDAEFKQEFAGILKLLLVNGVTIIMVSHDIEFCAKYADRCALFFDGGIVTEGNPKEFFSGNSFYTTSANRMSRHLIPRAITVEDVILACGGEVPPESNIKVRVEDDYLQEEVDKDIAELEKKRPNKNKKKVLAIISMIVMILTIWNGFPVLSRFAWDAFMGINGKVKFDSSADQWKYIGTVLLLIISSTTFFLSVFDRSKKPPQGVLQVEKENRFLSKRTIAAAILIFIFIPLTIFIGVFYLGDRKYYFISLLIIIEVTLPFIMIFEGRKPQARELVVISVLCAIGVAGRGAFFFIPQFKPVAAVVIISAVSFGGETGFLVGALTMFLSNMMYGQGPLTPWQMFAMGIIGFLAGVLFKKGLLRRDRVSLAIFGGVVVFFVYGGIMNPASVLTFQSKVTWPMIFTSLIVGAPFDLIHGGATVFFMLVMGEPMLEKLDRIKVKYGLVE